MDPVCIFHNKRYSEHEGGQCLYCPICFKSLTSEECITDIKNQKWAICTGQCAKEAGIEERINAPDNL